MDANISRFSSQVAAYTLRNYTSWETSIYLQDQWKILSRITAEIGARATGFSGSQGSFSSVDPRFSLVAISTIEHFCTALFLLSRNSFIPITTAACFFSIRLFFGTRPPKRSGRQRRPRHNRNRTRFPRRCVQFIRRNVLQDYQQLP